MSQHARTRPDMLDNQDGSAVALSQTHPALKKFQIRAVVAFGIVWLLMLIAAPILLILLLFDVNYTVQWLGAGVWVLRASMATTGIYLLLDGIDQAMRGGPRRYSSLLYGSCLLLGLAAWLFLVWYGTDERIPPLLVVAITWFLALLFIGRGVWRLLAKLDLPLLNRIFAFLGYLCYGVAIILLGLALKEDALGIDPDFTQIAGVPIALPILLVGVLLVGLADYDRTERAKTPLQRNVALGLLATFSLVLVVLIVLRYFG